MEKKINCGNCRWFRAADAVENNETGQCMFNPPIILYSGSWNFGGCGEVGGCFALPRVSDIDFCHNHNLVSNPYSKPIKDDKEKDAKN